MIQPTQGRKAPNPRKLRMLIYGAPGAGKTTFAAGFPNSLILDCEGGSLYCDTSRIEIQSWDTFRDAVRWCVANHDPANPRMICVDSLDRLRPLAIAKMGEPKNIKEWGRVNGALRQEIDVLMQLGGLILTSWEKSKPVKPDGSPYGTLERAPDNCPHRWFPTASGATWDHTERWVDVVARVTAAPWQLHAAPGRDYLAKDRTNIGERVPLNFAAFAERFRVAKEETKP